MKISLCIAVWNTSHLLRRSIYTYMLQDFPRDDWELIVIDDNSLDDVRAAIEPALDVINVRYKRLEHIYGMRGNTVSFNTAFEMARAPIIAETTPETMLPPTALKLMYEPHLDHERAFVSMKTYNLTGKLQLAIDEADWRNDIYNIATLPGWNHPWVHNNVNVERFGTHQTCSIKKDVFYSLFEGNGFPLYGDYGSEDPAYANQRENNDIKDITIHNPMPIHQWHAPFSYWVSKGYAPNLNKFGHSTSDYLGDGTRFVPSGGTCTIWDGSSHERHSDAEKEEYASALDDTVIATGVPEHLVNLQRSAEGV